MIRNKSCVDHMIHGKLKKCVFAKTKWLYGIFRQFSKNLLLKQNEMHQLAEKLNLNITFPYIQSYIKVREKIGINIPIMGKLISFSESIAQH